MWQVAAGRILRLRKVEGHLRPRRRDRSPGEWCSTREAKQRQPGKKVRSPGHVWLCAGHEANMVEQAMPMLFPWTLEGNSVPVHKWCMA